METTKLIVEYLIIGLLTCLSILFLIFNVMPADVQTIWLAFSQNSSLTGITMVAMLLPAAYGSGLIVEYLGMLPFESQFDVVKERRFPAYVQQNLAWLSKNSLFKNSIPDLRSLPKNAGRRMYGEMRFFVLMNSALLYQEIERHLNQVRILRSLTIVVFFFIVGMIVRLVTSGVSILSVLGLLAFILLLIFNIRAILHRFNQYCRAIERSFKALVIDDAGGKPRRTS